MRRQTTWMMAPLAIAFPLQAAADEPAQKPPTNLEKVHCVRHVETGSLMVGHKECHTEAEWRVIQDEARHSAANMMNAVRSNRLDATGGGPP